MKSLVLNLVLFFSLLNSAEAQVSVSGKVLGSDQKEPLIGAHVWKKANYKVNDVVNSQGFFSIAGLTKGDTLIFTFIGFKELYFPVLGKMDSAEIIMEPNSQQLEMVEVKGTILGAENFAYEKLSSLDIYMNPNSKADALLAINTNMSATTKDESATVAFRGASPQQTGYFLNGVPVKNPVKYSQLTNTGTLSIFNTEFLKSATVFPGNPPLEYGQATSGTVVLELADRFPDDWQHTAVVSMANLGYSSHGKMGESSYLGVFGNYQFDEVLKGVNTSSFKDINTFNALEGGVLFTTHHSWGSVKIYQYGLLDNYIFNFEHPSFHGDLVQNSGRSLTTLQWLQEFGSWQASVVAGNSFNNSKFDYGNMKYQLENCDPYTSSNLTYSSQGNVLKTGYAYWGQHSSISGNLPTFDYALAPCHPTYSIQAKDNLESHEYYVYGRKKWRDHSIGSGVRTAFLPRTNQQLWSYQANYLQNVTKSLTLKAGHGKYYQTRLDTEPQIIQQAQSSVDIDFQKRGWAFHQSLFRNHGDSAISGSETRISIFHKNKFQVDQTASFYHQNYSWDWFLRTFLKYNPARNWTFNLSFQTFKGKSYQLIQSRGYNSDLDVFTPGRRSRPMLFQPYMNLSAGASKLFQFSEKLNGIAFVNVANVFDFKNEASFSYNRDYSSYSSNYMTRRSVFAGVILNFIND